MWTPSAYLNENGFDEPDPADYGVWVPGVPVLVGDALEVCRRGRLAAAA